MSKLVTDDATLRDLARLSDYYARNIRPVQEKRIKDAMERRAQALKEQEELEARDGRNGNSAICDNGQSAVRSVDGLHLSV